MIGIFDSGVGGMSVLREIVKLFPSEKFVYYADSGNCPYGDKSREFIIERSRFITRFLLDKGASLIVVACNTATAAAISTLRREWPSVPFVGIEPAVKPAALGTRSGVIGVLATAGTLRGGNYLDLRGRWSSGGIRIVEQVGRGFVELVEKGVLSGPEAEAVVRAALEPLIAGGADTIVLGCTHYPFLLPVIQKVAAQLSRPDEAGPAGALPPVRIIDPAPAVAAQAARLYTPSDSAGEIDIYSSGDEEFAREFWELAQKASVLHHFD